MDEGKYISFGPVANPDGTPTEFTKKMFGLPKEAHESVRKVADFGPITKALLRAGLTFIDSVPCALGRGHVVIAFNPWRNTYSTHLTEYDYCSVCYGRYHFETYEGARLDALKRAA